MIRSIQRLCNGCSVPISEIPVYPIARFTDLICEYVENGARITALFVLPESRPLSTSTPLRLVVILGGRDESLGVMMTEPLENPSYPSISARCSHAHLFEMEIREQWGLTPIGHPYLMPLRFQQPYLFYPDTTDPLGRIPGQPLRVGEKEFFSVRSEDMHGFGLGPIYNTLAEPVYFRFQLCGDNVYTLEPSLGYQYRRIEDMLIGGPHPNTLNILESISGENTVAHTVAGVQLYEALANVETTERGHAVRGILLELERIYGHLSSSIMIASAISMLSTLTQCRAIRNAVSDIIGYISGHRLGRHMIFPGGVASDVSETTMAAIGVKLGKAVSDYDQATAAFLDTPSAVRKLSCGRITEKFCTDYRITGPAARAVGIDYDVRQEHPFGIYKTHPYITMTESRGDARSRFALRRREIQASASYIIDSLITLPDSPHSSFDGVCLPCQLTLQPNALAVSMVEGTNGEHCHVGATDAEGKILQYKIFTPSVPGFFALAQSMRDEIVTAFPIIQGSFALSAADHDL